MTAASRLHALDTTIRGAITDSTKAHQSSVASTGFGGSHARGQVLNRQLHEDTLLATLAVERKIVAVVLDRLRASSELSVKVIADTDFSEFRSGLSGFAKGALSTQEKARESAVQRAADSLFNAIRNYRAAA